MIRKNICPTLLNLILCFCLSISKALSQEITEPIFKDGDKVCFIGNSITNNALFYNYINLFYATRYPDRKVNFINCGISGDVTQGIINRMESDILIHKPTWTVLMIGMNDVNRGLYSKLREKEAGIEEKKKQALDIYKKNLEIIVIKLLENGRKLILEKPTIYDQTADLPTENMIGVNEALKECAAFGQKLAEKYNLPAVDYWTILSEINRKVQQSDKSATIIGKDRIHPGGTGHLIMAYEFLKATGADRFVSNMVIHKNSKKRKQLSKNCQIENVKYKKNIIQFSVTEAALPFPIANDATPALALVPFTERFNQEILQIEDITNGSYQLSIDDLTVGTYRSEDLKKGINLALLKTTPQYIKAAKIMELYNEFRRNQLKYRNIVSIEIHHLPDSLKEATMESKKLALAKRLNQKYEGTNAYEYHKGQFKSYLENKQNEQDITNTLSHLITQVYQLSPPETHIYNLVKTLPKNQLN